MVVNSANKGFTLVEVLVTMVIFAIIGIASFQVLNQMVNTEEQSQNSANNWNVCSLASC